jgi:hypothetical protein
MALADALHGLLRLPGATYACVVERDSGRVLAEAGRGDGAAGDGEGVVPYSVARWGTAVAAMFDSTSGDELDDVMITGRRSYHLVRPVTAGSAVLAYLRLDRRRANLAAARRELAAVRWGAGAPPAAAATPARGPSPAPASAAVPPSTATPPRDPSAGASPTGPRPPAAFPARRAAAPVGAGQTPGSTPGGGPRIPLARRTPTRPSADATRRPAVAAAPAEVPAGLGPPAVVGQQWVRDPSTLRRLIAGLRRMS